MLFSTVHIYDCFIVKSINMNISIWLVNIVAHYDEYILKWISTLAPMILLFRLNSMEMNISPMIRLFKPIEIDISPKK